MERRTAILHLADSFDQRFAKADEFRAVIAGDDAIGRLLAVDESGKARVKASARQADRRLARIGRPFVDLGKVAFVMNTDGIDLSRNTIDCQIVLAEDEDFAFAFAREFGKVEMPPVPVLNPCARGIIDPKQVKSVGIGMLERRGPSACRNAGLIGHARGFKEPSDPSQFTWAASFRT